MSSPTVRFEDFNASYTQYKLGEITETISRRIKMEDKQSYRLVTVKRRNGGIIERGIFTGEDIKVKSQFKIKQGDFLISKRQIIHGACELVPKRLDNSIVSNEYHVLHGVKELLLTEYLNLLSKTPKMKHYFALACVGVDIEKMLFRIDDWKKRSILLPSIEEQEKVVTFFSLLDLKIQKQLEKIKKLEELKKGMMQKVFSREIRFKDENGEDFPEWEAIRFESIVEKLIGGGTPSRKVEKYYGGNIPWVTVKDLKANKYISDAEEYITELGLENSSSKIVDKYDLIIPTRMAVGRILIAKENVAINQDLKGCKLKPGYDTEFIYYLYTSKSTFIERLGSGSTVSGISIDDLMGIRLEVPSLNEQEKIANYFRSLDIKLDNERQKFKVLKQQKKAYMQRMLV